MSIPPQGHLHEHLLAENLISHEQLEVVLHRVRADGSRIEDVLIESGAISEADLLKFLAKLYRTRFVATNKLARAEVDRGLLEVIPRRLAEEFQVFPVLFDPASSTLSVVSPDAGDPSVLEAVQQASNARDVRVYVARPAAVRAAILKHYAGELYAFAQVDTTGREQYLSMIDLYAQHTIQAPTAPSSAPASPTTERRERVVSDSDVARAPQRGPSSATARASFMEMLTVLVSLLENNRGELRGHSPLVSRWTRKLAERIRLAPEEAHALVLAALLHDVGKAATYHLTALNVAMFDNHRIAAQKTFQTAIKIFEAVPLEPTTVTTLHTMYERFDGQGFPDGLAGKEIPLGARILAVVDTYADLTQNPNNPYRRQLTAPEACDVLDRHKGTVFDRNLVDLLRQVVTGDDLRAKLLSERTVVLLIDPDPEESTVLELRMVEEGFEVHLARNVEEARGVLARGSVEAGLST
jgi:HD-GYP domain-containing protein (c-di-GMP phosphodiesterase class II)